ncbi:hypothetical protein [Rhizobium sp. L1K21]|uniref:hypothetical protein n=1 Tax=Rhizobium sp. L1K21 TaxID=2954933 RepID=UPI0020933BAC|nr:hypothetical protein [Rhizobium sp. L1K21]MCO6187161.1 hypothetical protein [Rhizobium sp. L1K21]
MKPKLTPEEARRDHNAMLFFMARHFVYGVIAGIIVSASIFYFDIGNLRTHTTRASNKFVPVFLITLPMCILFGGSALGGALMMMPYGTKYHEDE